MSWGFFGVVLYCISTFRMMVFVVTFMAVDTALIPRYVFYFRRKNTQPARCSFSTTSIDIFAISSAYNFRTMSVSKSEADIVFNRANVALARSQRLIASWLPPKTAEEIANTKTEEELQREEDEIFTAVPEKCVFTYSCLFFIYLALYKYVPY